MIIFASRRIFLSCVFFLHEDDFSIKLLILQSAKWLYSFPIIDALKKAAVLSAFRNSRDFFFKKLRRTQD